MRCIRWWLSCRVPRACARASLLEGGIGFEKGVAAWWLPRWTILFQSCKVTRRNRCMQTRKNSYAIVHHLESLNIIAMVPWAATPHTYKRLPKPSIWFLPIAVVIPQTTPVSPAKWGFLCIHWSIDRCAMAMDEAHVKIFLSGDSHR